MPAATGAGYVVLPFNRPQLLMRSPVTAVVLAAATAVIPVAVFAQGALAARVDSVVRAEMAARKIPGVAVAVIRRGVPEIMKGYGLANVELRVPVTPETIFQSGSLGKQFTAAAVMLLVEEGKIELDKPITTYLDGAPAAWAPITVRHLLTHTSGIPDYTGGSSIDYRRDYTEPELVTLAFGLPLEFPAGSRWNYSNTGYVLLGAIIRKASGRFYGELLRDRVFAPAGMKTARVISEEEIVPNRAAGYRLVEGELRNQQWVAPQINTTADGSLYLSLRDLVAWDQALRTRSILRRESWERILTPATLTSGKHYPYGFGWSVDSVGGQPVNQHGGSWQGFKTYLARYLGDDMTVIVLANLAQANPGRLAERVAGVYNPRIVRQPPRPIADNEPAVTNRVRELLATAAAGRLTPADFAYVRAGFFPESARHYQAMLTEAGAPAKLTLMERREIGDDRIYTYDVEYPSKKRIEVSVGLAPDGKISAFSAAPR